MAKHSSSLRTASDSPKHVPHESLHPSLRVSKQPFRFPILRRITLNICIATITFVVAAKPADAQPVQVHELFQLTENQHKDQIHKRILENWDPRYTAPLLELHHIFQFNPKLMQAFYSQMAASFRVADTGFNHQSRAKIQQALWRSEYQPLPGYAAYKAALYRVIDRRFAAYFDDHTDNARIRLDEVQWGGVRRDGIPPLKNPTHVQSDHQQAGYLADTDIVFGVTINGESRAYPKRILAWHEMVKDHLGGESINGVYCTLCGSMIVYNTLLNDKHYELGTSGFLYRSNKLMYDHETESMWSTISGEPVIGPLVGQGIKLKPKTVVTTTWGQWKHRHPTTTVITLDTGHKRDYGEGVAYRQYFATDQLMFQVPKTDLRLKNKASVLALRFGAPDSPPLAIASDFLKNNLIYTNTHGGQDYVVLTDTSGAHRAYALKDVRFTRHASDKALIDDQGVQWIIQEEELVAPDGRVLNRLPSHNAFWFGWYAAHPDTMLIQE